MTQILHTSLLLALLGQSPYTEPFDTVQTKRYLELYKRQAAQYEVYLGDDTKLKTNTNPVYRFVRQTLGNHNGTLFVWTHDGRTEVIGSIWGRGFKTEDGKRPIVHEFLSIAAKPVRAERDGKLVWHPAASGIEFKPVPDAPKPAATDRLRLIQIRGLARNFSATELVRGKWDDLRMLPQPIYRYEPESTDAPDGAVFAFLWDYDPEAFLIIEERETPAGRRWHYALAKFGAWQLSVRHKDIEVWSRNYSRAYTRPQNPHFSRTAMYTDYSLSDPAADDDRDP